MKIKLILSAVCFLISSESMFSQGSLNISISPGGLSNKEIYNQDNDNTFNYDFKNVVGAQIAYEYMKNGKCFLAELSYYNGKFDRAELKGTSSTFNPEKFKDYNGRIGYIYGFNNDVKTLTFYVDKEEKISEINLGTDF